MPQVEQPAAERMRCMEIWGGNRAINKSFQAPGLDLFVHSIPFQSSKVGGGDLYYLTSCASGRISRLLLADVSGHGETAAQLAVTLRDLLRENVNTISQEQFIEGMNQAFGSVSKDNCFATAIVATYFDPKKRLTIGLAGHPYPFFFSAAQRRWVYLDPELSQDSRLGNMPLGVIEDSNYPGRQIKVAVGDMFLMYSDAFIESVDGQGQILGIEGVLELLNGMTDVSSELVIPTLREKIQALDETNLDQDDATILLGCFTQTRVRLRDSLLAPFRLLGNVRNNIGSEIK